MTYDQAQSPRLGQRVPVESTFVQIVDVDPLNEIPDLPEAAYPGQLIYRNDLSILQIWSFSEDTWVDVAGGVAGQATYVGDEMPTGTGFSIGDIWFDSDAGYLAYVWDGDSWELSAVGITTYYETGFIPNPAFDPGLPEDPDTNPAQLWVPLVGTFNVGDLWYQTDDSNHPYRWSGTIWVDLQDPNIPHIQDNTDSIIDLNVAVAELSFLARSANNTADTADGRVSMSDYQPGADDVLYEQITTKEVYDPETGAVTGTIEVSTMVPRVNGSIWFTRTRPRRNLCKNPSFETNTTGWSTGNATMARATGIPVPAGLYTLQVTNNATVSNHYVQWGLTLADRVPCEPGQIYTVSTYAELVSGTQGGDGVSMMIIWTDAAGAFVSQTNGVPRPLDLNAFDPATLGTYAEPRVWLTGEAPEGAAGFYARVNMSSGNEGVVWHTGALLIEEEDDLGRYFDGDSYNCSWTGTAHGSESEMVGDRIIELWELRDSSWIQKFLAGETINDLPAAKLTAPLDGVLLSEGTVLPTAMKVSQVVTSEALVIGDLVNVWNSSGGFRVRKANAANRYEAHGYVRKAYASGALAAVYSTGYDPHFVSLAPGAQWLSTTAGRPTNIPPSAVGQLVQRVGFATAAGWLDFTAGPAIRIG